MFDHCLHSGHLDFPRRQEFRRRREQVLAARGLVTLAAEQIRDLVGDSDEWPILPEQVIPGTRYLLVDHAAGCAYQLHTGLNTMGRYPDNDVRFDENCISRRHCVILVHAWGGCELHDTASRNGTFVNNVRVTRPARLTSGDSVQIPGRRFRFLSEKDYRAEYEGFRSGPQEEDCPPTGVV
jgi:adenylate cyclase